jgi:hypothetical protein
MFSPLPLIVYAPLDASYSTEPAWSTVPTSLCPSKTPTAGDCAEARLPIKTTPQLTIATIVKARRLRMKILRRLQLASEIPTRHCSAYLSIPILGRFW